MLREQPCHDLVAQHEINMFLPILTPEICNGLIVRLFEPGQLPRRGLQLKSIPQLFCRRRLGHLNCGELLLHNSARSRELGNDPLFFRALVAARNQGRGRQLSFKGKRESPKQETRDAYAWPDRANLTHMHVAVFVLYSGIRADMG